MEHELLSFPSVKLWHKKTVHSKRRPMQTVERLNQFFMAVKSTPGAVMKEWRKARYDYRMREMFIDEWSEKIEAYYYDLKDDYAPETKHSIITPVISYFKHSKIPVDPDIQERIYVKYHNRDISKEEIARILEHASLRDRTFFLWMAESGQRPYTLVQLRYKHIREDFEAHRIPMKIDLPAELIKDRVGHRFTFVGEDGYGSLKEYLAPRGALKDEDLIFQPERPERMKNSFLGPTTFSNAFSRIVVKLGLDKPIKGGKPKSLRLYCLRKYFRNNIRVRDVAYREFWMGHTFGTDEHYLTRNVERHREEYSKAYDSVRVLQPTIPEEIAELKAFYEEKLRQQREEIELTVRREVAEQLTEEWMKLSHITERIIPKEIREKLAKAVEKEMLAEKEAEKS